MVIIAVLIASKLIFIKLEYVYNGNKKILDYSLKQQYNISELIYLYGIGNKLKNTQKILKKKTR